MTKGGKRAGAGRKAVAPAEKQELVTIRLRPAEIERLRELGAGNVRDGIRRLLEQQQ